MHERDELAETPSKRATHPLNAISYPSIPQPATPAVASPVKLPMSEMHPSKVHPTTAAPSSGLKLGFSDIDYTKKPTQRTPGAIQSTPSKTPAVPASDFTFRYTKLKGDADNELTPTAKKMMQDIREEAEKFKAELAAQREQEKLEEEEAAAKDGRKIRQAKGKAGRYSAVHMAEFKKMDSIENHPSAYRAIPGSITPAKGGLKRSQSKANLDEPESVRSKKVSARPVSSSPEKQQEQPEQPESPVKRARQRFEEDVSTLRPVSRDASSIPRPKSSGNDSIYSTIPRSQTLSNLMTPTKSSLTRTVTTTTRIPTTGLLKSPSKPNLSGLPTSASKPDLSSLTGPAFKKGLDSLKRSMTTNNLAASKAPTQVQTPGRFARVKSILKKQMGGSKPKSGIPTLAASPSKTSLHPGVDEELHNAPLTTPGRKLERHMVFTQTAKRATMLLNSPSPVKSSLPRSKAMSQLSSSKPAVPKFVGAKKPEVEGEVTYPDLSAYCRDIKEDTDKTSMEQPPETIPGRFTFRSDHTIRFDGTSGTGFGAAAGQASLRHVRKSVVPATQMPGGFPSPSDVSPSKVNKDAVIAAGIPHGMPNKKRHRANSSDVSPNKENKDPVIGAGIPHGMSNKKRHRASSPDEEMDEGAKRGAKKLRKAPSAAVQGHALVAPRLAGRQSPVKTSGPPGTPSPQKKKGGISLSRLNMLARPKVRK